MINKWMANFTLHHCLSSQKIHVFFDSQIDSTNITFFCTWTTHKQRLNFWHKSSWTHQIKHAAQENNMFGLVVWELKDKKNVYRFATLKARNDSDNLLQPQIKQLTIPFSMVLRISSTASILIRCLMFSSLLQRETMALKDGFQLSDLLFDK